MFIYQLFSLAVLLTLSSVSGQATQLPQAPYATDQGTEQAKLSNAQNQWRFQNPLYYDFQWTEQRAGLVGNYPWRVQYSAGAAARAVDSKANVMYNPKDVVSMFSEIQNALTDPSFRVYAQYNANYGYPELYQIQYGTTASAPITTYRVSAFAIQTSSPQGLYQQNLNLWNSQRVTNYQFQYTDWMDQDRNINWPLTVNVVNSVVGLTTDTNNNQVNYLVPMSIQQYFELISRQLSGNSPYVDVTYAQTFGYPDLMYIVGHADGKPIAYTLQNFRRT